MEGEKNKTVVENRGRAEEKCNIFEEILDQHSSRPKSNQKQVNVMKTDLTLLVNHRQ